MMRLFIGACIAVKSTWRGNDNRIDTQTAPVLHIASNRDEAYGWVMADWKRMFPSSTGYGNHDVFLLEVPVQQVRDILAKLEEGEVNQ